MISLCKNSHCVVPVKLTAKSVHFSAFSLPRPAFSWLKLLGLAILCVGQPPGVSGQDASEEADGKADASLQIVGKVVDEQGKPIANAEVDYPFAFDKRFTKTLSSTAVTDENGDFQLKVSLPEFNAVIVDSVEHLVWAHANGYCLASARIERDPDSGKTRPVHITLPPESDTSFLILDPQGRPLSDALVEPVNYKSGMGFSAVPTHTRSQLTGRSDAEGRVHMPALSRDRLFRLWVSSREFGTQSQRFDPSEDEAAERKIELRSTGGIVGKIPVHNPEWTLKVKLWFTSDERMIAGQQRPPWPTEGVAKASLDAFGRFRVPQIAEGRVRIDTIVDESLMVRPEIPRTIEVKAGETAEFEVPMRDLITIHGSVIAEDTREPMPGIKLHVYYGKFRQGTDVETDENGEFTALVLPGPVRFQPMNLYGTKYLQLGQPRPIDVGKNDETIGPIVISVSEPRQGTVVNHLNAPISNATIFAYYNNWMCSSATSNAEGVFELPKMPVSISSGDASYRVKLEDGTTIYSRDVSVESASPLVIKTGL